MLSVGRQKQHLVEFEPVQFCVQFYIRWLEKEML